MTFAICQGCGDAAKVSRTITMALQPIVDVNSRDVFAHEALVRGVQGEPAREVLESVRYDDRYAFDQACRIVAIRTAAKISPLGLLAINFLANAVYNPEHCLRATLEAAMDSRWPLNRIIFEVTEHEEIVDHRHLIEILSTYKAHGFLTAIDDFGAGFAGMNLLADFQPDIVKLDLGLIRGIDTDRPRQCIVRHIVDICRDLNIRPLAEGVESLEEYHALRDMGIVLQQGFLFARPKIGIAPAVHWPD